MKLLVAGAKGMLGKDVVREARGRGFEVIALGKEELDVTDRASVQRAFEEVRPDAVLNCAAYTNVDGAEKEPGQAFAVNALGVRNLAAACRERDVVLVHFSTDYVFDGEKKLPYLIFDRPGPINTYGRSKLYGEEFLRIISPRFYLVRTSWLFGSGGKNFVETVLNLAREKGELTVVDDQEGCPTYSRDLARAVLDLLETGAYGTYHITNRGSTTWHAFACEILEHAGLRAPVYPVKTAQLGRPARRPLNSKLDPFPLEETLGYLLPPWQDALRRYFQERERGESRE